MLLLKEIKLLPSVTYQIKKKKQFILHFNSSVIHTYDFLFFPIFVLVDSYFLCSHLPDYSPFVDSDAFLILIFHSHYFHLRDR